MLLWIACWLYIHTHTVMLSSYASWFSPAVAHNAHRHSRHVHSHYHAGRCLWPAALYMELRGARPVESEREAQEQATLLDTCQHSHTTSPRTSNTHIHTRAHNAHSHTHCSVARQICTRTHSPAACQTKVNVIRSMSWFHSLWIGYANAIQHGLVSTWQTYDQFFTEKLHHMQSGVMQLLNAICVNYVEHSHAVKPHYTTGTNWPLKVERSGLNSLQKWIILLMLSSILAVVQKSMSVWVCVWEYVQISMPTWGKVL